MPAAPVIHVYGGGDPPHRGRLVMGRTETACALGRAGIVPGFEKREGDGATPAALMPLRGLLYRADRLVRPATRLPVTKIGEQDGWCDDPAQAACYNRPVRLPFEGSAERLWRDDRRYDLIVPLGYNDDPPAAGRGSAIFLHVAGAGMAPTDGCVALPKNDLLKILSRCGPETLMRVHIPSL